MWVMEQAGKLTVTLGNCGLFHCLACLALGGAFGQLRARLSVWGGGSQEEAQAGASPVHVVRTKPGRGREEGGGEVGRAVGETICCRTR